MKRLLFLNWVKAALVCTLMIMFSMSGYSQIVAFDLSSNGIATGGLAANLSCTMTTSGITDYNPAFSANNGYTTYGWNAVGTDCWKTSAFTTAGYETLTGSFQMKSATNYGPRDFKVQYSLNGTSWTDVETGSIIVLTNSLVTYNFSLPSICDNKATVYVRWVLNSLKSLNGGTLNTLSSYNSSLKGVSIAGNPFAAPSTQASNISIISVTPTTIKIGCTNGNGDNRIILINNTNSFTDPSDDYYPTANSTYNGTGEQVIFNGSSSSVTVTVPSSTNVYWFRVYEFNKMDNLTRFITSSASQNPKQCRLETIHSPTSSNVKLTTATLGATINTPTTGTIVERGFYWSTMSGVDETGNLYSETSSLGGVFTINDVPVERGSTIYFKAFVTNESGTILSEESSFTNIPVFTGSGNWGDAARWNVQQVPGLNGDVPEGGDMDNPTINGACTLTNENTVNNLIINSGSGRLLNINPGVSLTVNGTLENNNGTGGLILKSDATGTGSLMHSSNNVDATVQRFISGTDELTAKKYHLVSVPINSATYLSEVWLYSYLFTYLESSDSWFAWDVPTTNILNPKEGAMVYYPNYISGTTSRTYNISGQLNNGEYSPTITTSGNGYNLVPNPYPSAINWDLVTQTNVENSIWIFNPDTKTYGVYNGSGTNGVTNIIPVGQAFFVKASGSGLTFDNTIRLHNHKAFMKSQESTNNEFHLQVIGGEGSDELVVKLRDDATFGKDNQYDAVKFYSDLKVPQISSFTETNDDLLSINTIPFTTNAITIPVRFELNTSGEVSFIGSGFESFGDVSIRLEDTKENTTVKLEKTPVYTFQHETGDDPLRFKLHILSTVGVNEPASNNGSMVYVVDRNIHILYPSGSNQGEACLLDMQGRELTRFSLSGSGNDVFNTTVASGIYIVRLTNQNDAAFKIIVK